VLLNKLEVEDNGIFDLLWNLDDIVGPPLVGNFDRREQQVIKVSAFSQALYRAVTMNI
jgi:hypothetical protein